jgi:N-alpha-acetyltransferase 35, NatC auxiliary subunit
MQETIGETVYNWTDVTQQFASLCQHLPIGEVVRERDFTLFEAMTALELMDPKMDGGMSIKNHYYEQQQGNRILTLKQLIERDLLKTRHLTSLELIHLFDQLLATFHMWLDGHSLALTLFTCVYNHDLTLVDDMHLRSMCLTLIKIIDYIRERILFKAGLFEEEDFSGTLTYNFPFYRELVKDQQCLTDLKKSEDELNKRLRALKHQTTVEHADVHATQQIIYRIRFLRLFFSLVLKFNDCDEKTGEQTYLNIDDILKLLKPIDELLLLIQPSCMVDETTVSRLISCRYLFKKSM